MSGRRHERGLTFAELVHAPENRVPSHTHETSFYHLMIGGGYEESSPHGHIYFPPFSSGFVCSGAKHDGRIAHDGARFFTIEISNAWTKELLELPRQPEAAQDFAGGPLTCRGIELYREYCKGSSACALAVDALMWELLAAAAAVQTQKMGTAPGWLRRVVELLHSEFRRDIQISDLAATARIHPVYLARVFRRALQQTPGEYLQRLRVRFAIERLSVANEGIAEIAAQAGFADQSHMTRIFKKYTLMTPGEFRRAFSLGHIAKSGRGGTP